MELLNGMLQIRHDLPENFLTQRVQNLHCGLSGPTLIHLPGARKGPVFVSILLHGNEDVGLKAIQEVLLRYQRRELPRELVLFVGNIDAAKHGLRKMPDGEDFNRVWPGTDHATSEISECMRQVFEYARSQKLFVSLDLHNNTGSNPLYGCVNRVDPRTIQLAMLFSRTIVHFQRPLGVQSAAFSELCPSITCECGRIGDAAGVQRAAALIDACLHMMELPNHMPPSSDFHLLHTVATLKIPPNCPIAFGSRDNGAELYFSPDLDHLNFRPLPPGTHFGFRRPGSNSRLAVLDQNGVDVESDYFDLREDSFILQRSIVPSMLTTNIQVIQDDCLGYFMEEFDLSSNIYQA